MLTRSQAIAKGTVSLYERIEEYEEALQLVSFMDRASEIENTNDSGFRQAAEFYHMLKAFCDKVWGDETEDILLSVWGGSVIAAFADFWAKPNKEIVERMAAARWANSLEAISDLRRFWGVRPTDVTTDELAAYKATLPVDSASSLSYSAYDVPLDMIIAAQAVDLSKLSLRQAGGKSGRLPEDQSMIAMLKKRGPGGEKADTHRELIDKERAYRKSLEEKRRAERRAK